MAGFVIGSPPRTRGARGVGRFRDPRCGITPAYAGSTASRPCAGSGSTDHPRVRGEHTF